MGNKEFPKWNGFSAACTATEFLRLFAKILNNVTQKNPDFGFFQKTNVMRLSFACWGSRAGHVCAQLRNWGEAVGDIWACYAQAQDVGVGVWGVVHIPEGTKVYETNSVAGGGLGGVPMCGDNKNVHS